MLKRIVTVLMCSAVLLSCNSPFHKGKDPKEEEKIINTVIQNLDYKDSGEVIFNPDMGFYSVVSAKVTKDKIEIKDEYKNRLELHNPICEDGVYPEKDNPLWEARFNQLLIEFDISSFSSKNGGVEKENGEYVHLPIDEIRDVLNRVKLAGKTALIRFAYDPEFEGEKGENQVEPEDFDLILLHIEDICAAVKDFPQVVTAIQCGMIGPWGEMHSTPYAGKMKKEEFEKYAVPYGLGLDSTPDKNDNYIDNGYLLLVMRKFTKTLEVYGCDVPLLVRQPQFIYDYLKRRIPEFTYDGETVPANYSPDKADKEFYRLGLYNDGYLSNDEDEGTFLIDRAAETDFIKAFTNHTPYGGEMIGDYKLQSGDCDSMKEMYTNHLSVLNIGYRESVFRSLNKFNYGGEPAFKYLIKHMGYRYVLKESSFEYPSDYSTLDINLKIENTGFANLPYHRKKTATVLLEQEGVIIFEKKDPNIVFNGSDMSFVIDTSRLPEGSYTVYLKVSDEDGQYPIRFANDLWNENLMANKIGALNKTL